MDNQVLNPPGAANVPGAHTNNALKSLFYRFGVSHLTGGHSLKFGVSDGLGRKDYT